MSILMVHTSNKDVGLPHWLLKLELMDAIVELQSVAAEAVNG